MVIIYMSRQSAKKGLDAAIRAAGKNGDIDKVIRIFQTLGAEADVYTYTAVITAAGNNNRMDLAEEAFRIALERNQADVVTHGNINDARQKNTISAQPTPTTRYRHNPYSLFCSWEADNTVPPTSTELSRVPLRR